MVSSKQPKRASVEARRPITRNLDRIETWLAAAREVIAADAELAAALAPFAVGDVEFERARRIAAACRSAVDALAEMNITRPSGAPPAEPVAPRQRKDRK